MKKSLTTLTVLLLALVMVAPAFAVEFKYGGMMRVRWFSYDDFDGNDNVNDNHNFFDQRARLYFTFVGSENLRVVTKLEMDTNWGGKTADSKLGHKPGTFRDAYAVEVKNVYMDFNVPGTPVNAKLGLQGFGIFDGWIFGEDYTGAKITAKFNPVNVQFGYVAEQNSNRTTFTDNVDIYYLSLKYANGPFSGELIGVYQDGHDTPVSLVTEYAGQSPSKTVNIGGNIIDPEDNQLFDLGLQLNYSADQWDAMFRFIKNFGSVDDALSNDSYDYQGWMIEAKGHYYINNLAFTLGGFYTSGADASDNDIKGFVYPAATGDSMYWSEIMGFGTLDDTTPNAYRGYPSNDTYTAGGNPSNLWTITAGISWQALEKTKLTFNYWYIGTDKDVIADAATGETDDSIGHEFDFYLDQAVVDGLKLRFVAAYMIADDAFSTNADDDNPYEIGARLQWAF